MKPQVKKIDGKIDNKGNILHIKRPTERVTVRRSNVSATKNMTKNATKNKKGKNDAIRKTEK